MFTRSVARLVPRAGLGLNRNNNSIVQNMITSSIINNSSSNSSNFVSNINNSQCIVRGFHSSAVNQGIEEFFEKKIGTESVIIGRPWTAADLRRKSFEDLQKLWYVLYKERNMLLSEREKRRRAMKASSLFDERRYTGVKRSMAAIKFVLAERREVEKMVAEEEARLKKAEIAEQNRKARGEN